MSGEVSGKQDISELLVTVIADTVSRSLRTNNWVWNSGTLAWERMSQPQTTINIDGDFTATIGDLEALLIGSYFKDVRYDYDSDDNCIYKGLHLTLGAAESDGSWFIIRYDYTSGNCIHKRFRITSWTNRTVGW